MSSDSGEPNANDDTVCIIGLGNPGMNYMGTRHNVGFRVVDTVAERIGLSEFTNVGQYLLATGTFSNRALLLVKPQTYMNLSGQAVKRILEEGRIASQNMLVICDDAALPLGSLRLRRSGSSGGQNGLQSIIDELGTEDFPRLRCGIGRPAEDADLSDYVLSPFDEAEREAADTMIHRASDAVICMIEKGMDRAMNEFNTSTTNTQDAL